MADEVIDTTGTNLSQLKERFTQRFQKAAKPRLRVVIVSFGYKYGVPVDADLIVDTRFSSPPFLRRDLRSKSGNPAASGSSSSARPRPKAFLASSSASSGFLMPARRGGQEPSW